MLIHYYYGVASRLFTRSAHPIIFHAQMISSHRLVVDHLEDSRDVRACAAGPASSVASVAAPLPGDGLHGDAIARAVAPRHGNAHVFTHRLGDGGNVGMGEAGAQEH